MNNAALPDWTVYVVDDDDLFRESITRNLVASGYRVAAYGDGRRLIADFERAFSPGVILLDWKMPGLNGIEVLRQLRDRGVDLPVIFLTVLGDQIYEEAALAGGAVDFIEKSRSFAIVQRRIDLIMGGQRAPTGVKVAVPLAVGGLEIDGASRRVRWHGRDVPLTLTECHIVEILAGRAGRDVGYRDLYDVVHGEGFAAGEGAHGYRANVRAFIKRIRQKFRSVDPDFDAISNYAGFGYRWSEDADVAGNQP